MSTISCEKCKGKEINRTMEYKGRYIKVCRHAMTNWHITL